MYRMGRADSESVNNCMFLYIMALVKNTAGKFWGEKSLFFFATKFQLAKV